MFAYRFFGLQWTDYPAIILLTFCDASSVVHKLISADATAGESPDKIGTQLITRIRFALVYVWQKTQWQNVGTSYTQSRSKTHTLLNYTDADAWVSEQFLNGTSAQYRLCSAILQMQIQWRQPRRVAGKTSPIFWLGDVNGNIPPILLCIFGYSTPMLVVLAQWHHLIMSFIHWFAWNSKN